MTLRCVRTGEPSCQSVGVPEVLPRLLGTGDAVVLGLASMLGAGVFTVFPPATRTAGGWLPLAVVLAGVVAACNAFSTADLAANQPESGGGYLYGRSLLAPWAGRLAGVAFLAGKTASAAAAAGVFVGYVLPTHSLWLAVLVIVVVSAMNTAGVRWTARGAWLLVPSVLAVLLVVVLAALMARHGPTEPLTAMTDEVNVTPVTPLGVLTGAGLIFFAFAGYARMATLSEEVRDPARTLRRAIPLALGIALITYLAVGASLLRSLGVSGLAAITTSPLAASVGLIEAPALGVLVRVGAAAASASALLSVLAGISRTVLAMARRHDLPRWLAAVGPRGTPWRADIAGALASVVVAALAGPAASVALSACCVLVYYAVINCAALRLPVSARRWPAWTSVLGFLLCMLLAALLPRTQVVVTAAVLVVGSLLSTGLAWWVGRDAIRDGPTAASYGPDTGPESPDTGPEITCPE
ncbi:MAG: APC family permease [Pseudonocardia sp.]|nr:APC family permease [Pseudonocardia sp.]